MPPTRYLLYPLIYALRIFYLSYLIGNIFLLFFYFSFLKKIYEIPKIEMFELFFEPKLCNTRNNKTSANICSISSLSQAMYHGSNRKRAFSTPHITPAISTLLNMSNNERGVFLLNNSNGSNFNISYNNNNIPADQLVYYMKTASPHDLKNSSVSGPWIPGRSDTNIYTNLALGHNRYKFLPNTQNYDAADDEDADEDEAIDQFSPTIYPTSRSIPIPIGNKHSPQHLSSGQQTPQLPTSPTHVAHSASPTSSAYPYSPFYGSSPESQTNLAGGGGVGGVGGTQIPIRMAYSYDHALGANFKRMPSLTHQTAQQQQQHTVGRMVPRALSLDATGRNAAASAAVMFATSPTTTLNRSVGLPIV